jgi:hypothetical protein
MVTESVVSDSGGGTGADEFGPLPGGSSGDVEFVIVNSGDMLPELPITR